MSDEKEIVWWLIALMSVMGVITHWLKQIAMTKRQNVPSMAPISIKEYWVTNWPETVTAFTSTIAGVALLHELGYVTPVAAFGVGYLGNSVADLIGGRVQSMINAAALPSQQKPKDGD